MISIAIDGPASAGKSTLAKALSKKIGFMYLDTGAIYRAVGYYFMNKGISPDNTDKVKEGLDDIEISLNFDNSYQKVILCGEDVTAFLRGNDLSMIASKISAIPEVRQFLLSLQRNIAEKSNVIMDGRDIGTVVLPNANVKIFLTASAEVRAKRRLLEYQRKGYKITYKKVLESIKERDNNDMKRSVAPLKPAEDAVIIDTTNYNFSESLNTLFKIVKERVL